MLLLLPLAASCATTIPVRITKPAAFDLRGAERIAVVPFAVSGYGSSFSLEAMLYRASGYYSYDSFLEQQAAGLIAQTMNSVLMGAGSFKALSAAEVTRLARSSGYAAFVDVFVEGEINELSESHVDGYEDVKNSSGSVVKTYFIQRELRLQYTYRFVRAADGLILGQASRDGVQRDKRYGDNAYQSLRSEQDMIREILRSHEPAIRKDVAPWQTTEHRALEKDAAKDPRMEEADALVKDGAYDRALGVYTAVYAETGNFAAGYNAAVLTEILGDLPAAIDMMGALGSATGNAKAVRERVRMIRTLADQRRLSGS